MFTTSPASSNIGKTSDDTFDTTRIVATINRLLSESAGAEGAPEVVELTVLGRSDRDPAHVLGITKVLYRASNCTVSMSVDMDAGALRGLEAGIAAD